MELAIPTKLAADETVLCGHGRIKVIDAYKVREAAGRAADKTLDDLKARLAASNDPREAALGLYMKGATDALLAIAPGRGDPQVYAFALLSCRYDFVGACALLSARQWADIDPDNGIPWVLAASAARNDKDARNQAVIRASAAHYFDQRLPDYLGMLQWPEIRNQAPQTRSALMDRLMGMQTSLPMVSYTPLIEFCKDSSIDPAMRKSVCSNLSGVLLRDRTLLGFSMGVRLAELAGWPRDELTDLRNRKAAYQMAPSASGSRDTSGTSSECDDLAAFEQWAADYSKLGEVGVAEKRLEADRASSNPTKRRR